MTKHNFALRLAQVMVSGKDRIRLYRKLSVSARAGEQLSATIARLKQRRLESHGKSNPVYLLLANCEKNLRMGKGLHAGFVGFASPSELLLLKAGEQGGNLDNTLRYAAELVVALGKVRSTILSKLSYPALLILILIMAVYTISSSVIPNILLAIPRERLTPELKRLDAIASLIDSEFGLVLLFLLVLAAIGFWYSMDHWTGPMRVKADRLPPWSFQRLMYGTAWLLSVSAMLKAGITTKEILLSMQKSTSSPWMLERLRKTLAALERGGNLGSALARSKCEFPDKEVIDDLIHFTEHSGQDEAIQTVADEWIKDGLDNLKKSVAILNICVMGLIFSFILYLGITVGNMGTMYTPGGF